MIRVVDIETTGMLPGEGAEVIELGWVDFDLECNPDFGQQFFSPERPCPPEVRAVHHIHPSQYENAPRFNVFLFQDWVRAAGVTYMAAHNAEYEQQFLAPMVPWLCTYKAALRVWPHAPHHGNQSLMYWLGLDEEISETMRMPPHRALPDAYVTMHILGRLLRETTVEQIAQWTTEPRLLPTCPIGEHKGKAWKDVDWGFLNWYVNKASRTEPDVMWNVKRELERRRTERLRGD